jgi:peptide methionine sulfoxide reductase msrA/msrB
MIRLYQKLIILAFSLLLGCTGWQGLNALFYNGTASALNSSKGGQSVKKINKSREEWKKELTPEEFKVMFQCVTEPAFSGKYNDFWEEGVYFCAACGHPLFKSETKYDHSMGWPSFMQVFSEASVEYRDDFFYGMRRLEARCGSCGAHLGHLFYDGPEPTGKHYCINSVALNFKPMVEARKELPQVATLAAGCFGGVEHRLSQVEGVLSAAVGYSGGKTKNPTYKQVCTGKTGHAESVQVVFDPKIISYEQLIRKFFEIHDPTQLNRQGPDIGTNYRSLIFYYDEEQRQIAERVKRELDGSGKYKRKIATEIVPYQTFYRAEKYHQKYFEKNKNEACPI